MNYTSKTTGASGKKVSTTTTFKNGDTFNLLFDIPKVGETTTVTFENDMYFQVDRLTRRSYSILINDSGSIESSSSRMAQRIALFVSANEFAIV